MTLTRVEEHVSHGRGLSVDLERMTAEDDTLRNYASSVCVEETSHSYQFGSFKNLSHNIYLLSSSSDIPCGSAVSLSNTHGCEPKRMGPYVVAMLVTPCLKYRSNLWTLLAPLPPPRVCWL
jgi:hypothetical protein